MHMTRNARWRSRRPRNKAMVHVPDFDTLVPAPELSLPIQCVVIISRDYFCNRERRNCTSKSGTYLHIRYRGQKKLEIYLGNSCSPAPQSTRPNSYLKLSKNDVYPAEQNGVECSKTGLARNKSEFARLRTAKWWLFYWSNVWDD